MRKLSIYVEGKQRNRKVQGTTAVLPNNCVAFMFDEIQNELNGIDRNRNVGITSIIKNYSLTSYDKSLIALNAGWNTRSDTEEGH